MRICKLFCLYHNGWHNSVAGISRLLYLWVTFFIISWDLVTYLHVLIQMNNINSCMLWLHLWTTLLHTTSRTSSWKVLLGTGPHNSNLQKVAKVSQWKCEKWKHLQKVENVPPDIWVLIHPWFSYTSLISFKGREIERLTLREYLFFFSIFWPA